MARKYNPGTLIRLNATFKSELGVVADPTTIKLNTASPDGTKLEYTYPNDIVKEGTGIYHYDILPIVSGLWKYSWTGSGAVQVVGIGEFVIAPNI